MRWFLVQLDARSRISAGRAAEVGNLRAAHTVLPGSVLRGGLASAWAVKHRMRWGSPTPGFTALFEGEGVFGQLVPAEAKMHAMSTVTCKYPDAGCPAQPSDLASRVIASEQIIWGCGSCGGALESGKGWKVPSTAQVSTSRTQLSGGVAEQGKLYSRQALREGIQLYGRIALPDDISAHDLNWLLDGPSIGVGGKLSVLGRAALAVAEITPEDTPAESVMALRCLSPVILLDDAGGPTLDPEPALRRLLGDGVTVLARWTRPVDAGGWHAASGLPKPSDWALATGSTFVLEGLPPDAATRLRPGLGLRTIEGYGEVELFHGRPDDQPQLRTRAQATSSQPVTENAEPVPVRSAGSGTPTGTGPRPGPPGRPGPRPGPSGSPMPTPPSRASAQAAGPAREVPELPGGAPGVVIGALRTLPVKQRRSVAEKIAAALQSVANAQRKGKAASLITLRARPLTDAWSGALGPAKVALGELLHLPADELPDLIERIKQEGGS